MYRVLRHKMDKRQERCTSKGESDRKMDGQAIVMKLKTYLEVTSRDKL